MVRETELCYLTRAGVEIGVASTKAFSTQLTALFLLTLTLAQASRLWGVESDICRALIESLVAASFLRWTAGGAVTRVDG